MTEDVFLSHGTALDLFFLARERGLGSLLQVMDRPADDPLRPENLISAKAEDGGRRMAAGDRGDRVASAGRGETEEDRHYAGEEVSAGGEPTLREVAAQCLTLEGFATGPRGLSQLDLGFIERVHTGKIDVLVPDREHAHASGTVCPHVWRGSIPPGGFLKLSEHIYVSSPEFVLLQVAAELDKYQTLQLAMQLCGTYALLRTAKHGMIKHPPLTSAQRILRFMDFISERRAGRKNYRWAARNVLDGAASTTEAGVSLLHSMSSLVGGYGLRPFKLNVEKSYDEVEREITRGKQRCFVDLLDEESGFGWEYQGSEGHSDAEEGERYERGSHEVSTAAEGDLDFTLSYGAESLEADTLKLAALKHMGYDVRSLVWSQIKTVAAFDQVARATAGAFGVDIEHAYAFSDDPRLLERRRALHRGLILHRYYWQDV